MQRGATFTRGLIPWLGLLLLIGPDLAAATARTGPSRKEILLWAGLGVLACVLGFVLYTTFYRLMLGWDWPVDFAVGIAFAFLLLLLITVALFVVLRLWPQPWERFAWYGAAVTLFVILLIAAFGRGRAERGT